MRNAKPFRVLPLALLVALSVQTATAQDIYKPFPVKMQTGKPASVDLAQILGEGDYIRLSGPQGLEISKKGVLTWTPLYGEHNLVLLIQPSKVHRFKIQVDDPEGGAAMHSGPSDSEPSTGRPRTNPSGAKPPRRVTDRTQPLDADADKAGGQKRQSYVCPGIAAAVLLPDNKTVVLSLPKRAELVFFNTETFQEIKKVTVDFKPGALAVQNENLYVAGQGAASVFVLDLKTGKQKAEIQVPGAGIVQLACHPKRGLLYASTDDLRVFAIDVSSGKANFSGARGHFLSVAPGGQFVYTGTQPASEDEVNFIRQADGSLRLIWDNWGARAFMAKYAVHGAKLDLAGVCSNAGVNARSFALSNDGEVVAMAGGGGWRPKSPTPGGGYDVVFFRTKDMTSTAGKVEVGAYPGGLAFHPVLKLGVAFQAMGASRLIVFHSKSFVTRQELSLVNGPSPSAYLGFGDRGRKIVFASDRGLHALPLELSDDDLALLKNAPAPTEAATADASPTKADGFPVRSWTDASGDYHIDARYAGFSGGNVTLIRKSGGRITMPVSRLSDEDQQYVRDLQGKQ